MFCNLGLPRVPDIILRANVSLILGLPSLAKLRHLEDVSTSGDIPGILSSLGIEILGRGYPMDAVTVPAFPVLRNCAKAGPVVVQVFESTPKTSSDSSNFLRAPR